MIISTLNIICENYVFFCCGESRMLVLQLGKRNSTLFEFGKLWNYVWFPNYLVEEDLIDINIQRLELVKQQIWENWENSWKQSEPITVIRT